MVFKSTMSIRVQTWSRFTEVYSRKMIPKTHVFTTFTTGYNIVPNGTKGGPLQCKFTGKLKYLLQRHN